METANGDNACPSAAPAPAGEPKWTLRGATGSVAVTGPTDSTAPQIKVDAPFSVTETQVHTLQPTVAVAMTSADGYPDGQPSAGIQPGDTLVFAIKILDASP